MATDIVAIERQRIGVFGGAFDPVHLAHIALARAAITQFQLEKVILVPSGKPPHRDLSPTSDVHRVAMLDIAIGNSSDLVIDDWELQRQVTTYTIDTLQHLCEVEGAEYFFLMGEDSLKQFTSWHGWEQILELCHLCVARRSCEGLPELPDEIRNRIRDFDSSGEPGRANGAGDIYFIDFKEMPISATAIRCQLENGKELLDLLDPAVMKYIKENRLYQHA